MVFEAIIDAKACIMISLLVCSTGFKYQLQRMLQEVYNKVVLFSMLVVTSLNASSLSVLGNWGEKYKHNLKKRLRANTDYIKATM